MKNLSLTIIFALLQMAISAQTKALGPINFGMQPKAVKSAVRSSDDMKLMGGQLFTQLLGQKYFGTFVYNENGTGLVGLWIHHYRGNLAGYSRNYNAYNTTELENDIAALAKLFNEQFGEPTIWNGFIHPGSTEVNRAALVGTWVADGKHIRLLERNFNGVDYPQIAIFDKTFMDELGENINEADQKEVEKTKSMF
jgi:hypothetical protein